MKNLNDLLQRLLESEVNFILIGGFAGVVHGASQVTQDLDICAVLTEDQIGKLRSALTDLKPVHRNNPNVSFTDKPKPNELLNNLYLRTEGGILDVIQNVIAVGDYTELEKNAVSISLFGKTCKVISLDDLIKSKEALNRPKDKALLLELKEIQRLKRSK